MVFYVEMSWKIWTASGDVMVSVFASSAIDSVFEPRSRQTKWLKLVSVASPLSMQHKGVRAKTGWIGIRIICPGAATCLSEDCCFSQLALLIPKYLTCWSSKQHLIISSNITCSRHDIAETLLIIHVYLLKKIFSLSAIVFKQSTLGRRRPT